MDASEKNDEFSIERFKRNVLIQENQRLIILLIKEHCERFKIKKLKITYDNLGGVDDMFLYDINEIDNVQKNII
jgi:hypothetical protein